MGIKLEYMPSEEVKCQPQSWQDKALGVVSFSDAQDHRLEGQASHSNIPEIHLNARVLSGSHLASEALLAIESTLEMHQPLVSDSTGLIHYRFDGELLFGVINLDESSRLMNDSLGKSISDLQQATEIAYQQIFTLIDGLGYSQVYRFWNYMADINGDGNDHKDSLERYRQFNIGRKNVFVNLGREQGEQLPAACALGLRTGPLSIAFLAGKTPAIAIENPRQVKAYHYPEQYGPLTPSFSRATLVQLRQQLFLFISGTASIVGHETLHIQDIIGQTNETLINLEAVVSEANRKLGKSLFRLSDACLRVYVRDAGDLDHIRETIHSHFNREVKAVFVQADICRQELLVEIEATLQETLAPNDRQALGTA
jgi:enamine deaminase RidA (YjgF/YER057c/UK114 family)